MTSLLFWSPISFQGPSIWGHYAEHLRVYYEHSLPFSFYHITANNLIHTDLHFDPIFFTVASRLSRGGQTAIAPDYR